MSRRRNQNKSGKPSDKEAMLDKSTESKGRSGRRTITKEKKSGNDPAWYAADPNLLRDAASYPFSFNTGATEIHDPAIWTDANLSVDVAPEEQIPGICSLRVYPCVGTALAATDPINVASQSVYSFVRHANSGHSNYDSPDLMLYILAMANMYSFLVWCQRLYGYALTYDQRNRYVPNELIRTNNVDPQDLVNNLATFRFWLNTLIAKMASFAVPATMSIFSRMTFLYSDYYIEGTSIKEQLYQYVPEGFYKFGIDSNSLGNLTWEGFNFSTLMTVSAIMTYGDALFNAIWDQEDFGIMSGDILKAYGDRIIKLSSIPEYYNIIPKFDPVVLTQMKNADLVRIDPSRISQSGTSALILQTLMPVSFSTSDKYYGTSTAIASSVVPAFNKLMVAVLKDYRILSVDTDSPTPDVVMEATRLKIGYDTVKSWYKAGTEIITKVALTIQPGTDIIIDPYMLVRGGDPTDVPMYGAITNLFQRSKHFHYVPRFWVFVLDTQKAKYDVYESFDIDNFTLLNFEDVKKLHEAATINMFAVPSVGKVQ